jgi:hypothetical protein
MSDLGPTPDLARLRGLLDRISAPIERMRREHDEVIAAAGEISAAFDEIAAIERGLKVEEAEESPDDWLDTATASERSNHPIDTVRKRCRNKGLGKKIRGRWWMTPREVEQWQSG